MMVSKICNLCQKTYPSYCKAQKFCSLECRNQSQRIVKVKIEVPYMRSCEICENLFSQPRGRGKYKVVCSKECKKIRIQKSQIKYRNSIRYKCAEYRRRQTKKYKLDAIRTGKIRSKELTDSYVRGVFKKLYKIDPTPELISFKRKSIKLKRLINEKFKQQPEHVS